MMKTAKQYLMESLIIFGQMFQLPKPSPEYLESIQVALRAYGWTVGDFKKVLWQLVKDDSYAESARFGKYPTIHDFLRVKKQLEAQPFYTALSAYLSGDWFVKEHINKIATPAQKDALLMSGGLENLYARATDEKSTPIYKLLNLVANNENANNKNDNSVLTIGTPQKTLEIKDK